MNNLIVKSSIEKYEFRRKQETYCSAKKGGISHPITKENLLNEYN